MGIALNRGRRRKKPVKQHPAGDEPLTQQVGRAATKSLTLKKQMRGRPGGWGKRCRRYTNKKLPRRGFVLDALIYVRFMGKRRSFSRCLSALHGVGLFSEEDLKAGEVLGYFTGELLSHWKGLEIR